jgi:murein DD-endopeptidase MepM/ murein hydrolase activator NlpD
LAAHNDLTSQHFSMISRTRRPPVIDRFARIGHGVAAFSGFRRARRALVDVVPACVPQSHNPDHHTVPLPPMSDALALRPTRPMLGPEAELRLRLGDEPALNAGPGGSERHLFSLRWLAASLLVGLSGAALLAAAIYVAVQGDTHFAETPEHGEMVQPLAGAVPAATRKGDRLVQQTVTPSARRVVRAPFAHRVGEREVIRVRPFVRLAAGLSLTSGVHAVDIPPFNPMRIFQEGGPASERLPEPAAPDVAEADVSLVKSDLAPIAFAPDSPFSDTDIVAQLKEERANLAAQAGRRAALPIPPQLMLGRTLRAPALPGLEAPDDFAGSRGFSSIEVRVAPENLTELAKTPAAATREPPIDERILLIRRGENFEAVMRTAGASADQIRGMVAALGGAARVRALPEGQVVQITTVAGARPTDPRQVVRVALINDGRPETMVAVNDRGGFVQVALTRDEEEPRTRRDRRGRDGDGDSDDEGSGARLYDSLYETALRYEMPRQLIDEMVRIFAHDLDFQRRVSGGDSLEVIFTDEEEGERAELLYASLSVGGETRRIYRFQAPDDGVIDFFDEEGRSLRKFLLRKPVAGDVEMRSGFGMRYHPILRYSKMHTGVDWANGRVGTPVIAAGNGIVIKAGWDSGYGRRVEIQHANGYVTTYSHLASFGRGIAEGARVRQGQVIGTIGNSGLSTGPHLHYEVVVNGNFVNPMKIRLPRGRELEGRILAEFRRQRDVIEDLIVRGGGSARVAGAARLN